ncbi:hypothetical protein CHS0354_037767 [Potamilus streckersoni]|uniref:Tetratricopeptide repeat protein 1 n=1 Tax=Potamilus streckersoni TaxID=2493646 RepID=A0AAE0T3A7_9BIVA|nr:hypothetical protein CHS0354_037767 [Potamilus streckersoni]
MEHSLYKHQDFIGTGEGLDKFMESLSIKEKSSKEGTVKDSQDDTVNVDNVTIGNGELTSEHSAKNPDIAGEKGDNSKQELELETNNETKCYYSVDKKHGGLTSERETDNERNVQEAPIIVPAFTGNSSPKSGNEGDKSNENSNTSECYSSEEDEERCASECECETDKNDNDECNNKNESLKGDNPNHSSDTEGEYESAEEGDEQIEVEEERLNALEETLSEEEKEERRTKAQALKDEGNALFKSGSYKSAIRCYTQALCICPMKFVKDRAIMYSNRAACKLRRDNKEEAIRDCTKALNLHPHYVKALLRRAELYEASEKLDDALADYQKVVELDPSQNVARLACMKLPDQIKERNEKLKEEMIGKLKDLGNMILKPFGLSTDNFKMTQDPNTGGYSVSFQQNSQEK